MTHVSRGGVLDILEAAGDLPAQHSAVSWNPRVGIKRFPRFTISASNAEDSCTIVKDYIRENGDLFDVSYLENASFRHSHTNVHICCTYARYRNTLPVSVMIETWTNDNESHGNGIARNNWLRYVNTDISRSMCRSINGVCYPRVWRF